MKNNSSFFARWSAGVFGGTILGIAGLVILMGIGGNYGCWPWIDALFGTAGYESCGAFGFFTGELLGALLGILIFSFLSIKNNRKTALRLLIAAFILPFIYGVLMLWPPLSDIAVVPPIILIAMLFASVFSLLIASILAYRSRSSGGT